MKKKLIIYHYFLHIKLLRYSNLFWIKNGIKYAPAPAILSAARFASTFNKIDSSNFFYQSRDYSILEPNYKSKTFYFNYNISNIKSLLDNHQGDNYLQLAIEKSCFDFAVKYEENKIKVVDNINFDSLNPELSNEMAKSHDLLLYLIKDFSTKMDLIINKKIDRRRSDISNKLTKDYALLSKDIFEVLESIMIANVIIGYWFRFVCQYNISSNDEPEKTIAVSAFNLN